MESTERLVFLLIAVSLAYGVGCLGRNRRIGFGWAFVLSLINVILGLIVTLLSKKRDVTFIDVNEEEKK